MKPGSDLAAITHTVNKDTGALTKQDAVFVWGGIRDISRNETQKGLCQIRNFVEKHSQTNVLVVNVPNRFDLGAHSCVNYEVKAFNRKLDKHMKSFQNPATVKVTSDRDHFTQHGLHLNRKGKEHAAKTIASSIKEIFKPQKKDPINMSWKEEQKLVGANTVSNNVDKDDGQIIDENKQIEVKNKRKTNYPLNEPGDYSLQDMMIFYGRTSPRITKCER